MDHSDHESPGRDDPASRPSDRRRFILTAAGLLVPAAGLASIDDAEAGRARRRRQRRRRRRHGNQPPPVGGMVTDDVLVNLINQTPARWKVQTWVGVKANVGRSHTTLDPQRESGWNPGVEDWTFGGNIKTYFTWDGPTEGGSHEFHFEAHNPLFGKPYATLRHGSTMIFSERGFAEGETVTSFSRGVEYSVQRWSDGDETFGGHTEEYCRWVVLMRS
ncbi:MAG: hypothetical protein ACKOWF_06345 [Chloroflexota bacterium]